MGMSIIAGSSQRHIPKDSIGTTVDSMSKCMKHRSHGPCAACFSAWYLKQAGKQWNSIPYVVGYGGWGEKARWVNVWP